MKKHILVVTQYFFPEQFRINDICEAWINKGYKVTVLTGIPNYPQGKYYKGYGIFKKRKENFKGMDIIRIPLIPRGKNPLMLILNYLSFVISGFFFAFFTRLKADLVFVYEVSPMTQALPGVWFAKRKKIPCILYVMDLWPENVEIVSGIKAKVVIELIGKIVDYIYKRCNKILVSSKSFILAIEHRTIATNKIIFWPQYAEDFYTPLSRGELKLTEIPNDSVFNIVFAGNIGHAQGLDVLPKTAILLKEKNINVRFNIVGDGRAKADLVKMAADYEVKTYFNFIEKQPAKRIPEFLALSDATLICLSRNKVFEMTLPAKLQAYMACCVPIIVCADGEVTNVINEAKAGLCVPAGDPVRLADAITKMIVMPPEKLIEFGENAGRYYKEFYAKKKLLEQIDQIFSREMVVLKNVQK